MLLTCQLTFWQHFFFFLTFSHVQTGWERERWHTRGAKCNTGRYKRLSHCFTECHLVKDIIACYLMICKKSHVLKQLSRLRLEPRSACPGTWTPAQGAMWKDWNVDNFPVPVSAQLNQKQGMVSQSPCMEPTLGHLSPNKVDCMTPANSIFLILSSLFLILYPINASAPFCSSWKGDCLLHGV